MWPSCDSNLRPLVLKRYRLCYVARIKVIKELQRITSRKHAYIILTPLNPTYIQ